MHIIYTHTKQLDCAWTFIRLPRRIATHMSQLYENTHIHKYIVYALVAAYFVDERDPQLGWWPICAQRDWSMVITPNNWAYQPLLPCGHIYINIYLYLNMRV